MLDRLSAKPLYQQMEELIRKKLEGNEWVAGSLIPSENELSALYGVSRMTARGVITKFVQEGVMVRIPGKGTFVAEHKIEARPPSYAGLREQLEQTGYDIGTRLLFVKKIKARKELMQVFHNLYEPQFYMISRLRFVKAVPQSLHTSYVPLELCPGIERFDLEEEPLCAVLSRAYGINRKKTVETLEAVSASQEDARLLGVLEGSPLLLLKDILLEKNGQPYEYTKVLLRSDKLNLRLEF